MGGSIRQRASACAAALLLLGACGARGHGHASEPSPGLADRLTVAVAAGSFVMGSDLRERAFAVALGRARPGATARAVREERPRRRRTLPAYRIQVVPVTGRDYARFLADTGGREPFVPAALWRTWGSALPAKLVAAASWSGGEPPPGREAHPVVLVAQDEAAAYCAWWGRRLGGTGRLPSEAQWEKAARGEGGRIFPWGERYEPARLNDARSGPGTTTAVGSYPEGASPYGALDMAGNVFEWTRTGDATAGFVVKGGAFVSGPAHARAAARHLRPGATLHPAIGFRCVLEP